MKPSVLRPILLNSGHLMPRLGVGTFQLLGDKCQDIIHKAVQVGYRHIDTAQGYGNEQDIGAALQTIQKKDLCKREDIFVTTKLANVYQGPKDVTLSLEESLEKLKSKYIDLFLIHSPWGLRKTETGTLRPELPDGFLDTYEYDLNATWKAMETAVKHGKVKSIGLSNFTEAQIVSISSAAQIQPSNVQLECHAYYQQNRLRKYLSEKNISCTAYSPLGALDRPARHKVPENESVILLDEPVVKEIAMKHGVTPALVLIRYLMELDLVVIPKTTSSERLEANYKVCEFKLDNSDLKKMSGLDRGIRFFIFKTFSRHPDFPKPGEPF